MESQAKMQHHEVQVFRCSQTPHIGTTAKLNGITNILQSTSRSTTTINKPVTTTKNKVRRVDAAD